MLGFSLIATIDTKLRFITIIAIIPSQISKFNFSKGQTIAM